MSAGSVACPAALVRAGVRVVVVFAVVALLGCGGPLPDSGRPAVSPQPAAPGFPDDELRVVDGRTVPTQQGPTVSFEPASPTDLSLPGWDVTTIEREERCVIEIAVETRTLGFEVDSAELSESGQRDLDLIAGEQLTGAHRIVVAGHTSAEGDREHNLQLAADRAATVAAVLAKRLPGVPIEARGEGPDQPVADNATEAGRVQNRRVEITAELEQERCGQGR
jgi:outer membrane protein OmpA-like peptidoglycan-associated protein